MCMIKYIVILVLACFCSNLAYATTKCKDTDTGNGIICMSDQPSQSDMAAGAGSSPAPVTSDDKYNSSQSLRTNISRPI